jgi:tRNA nucleotidyltransferase/poly(A) polymerase
LAFARHLANVLGGAFVALDRKRKTGRVVLKTSPGQGPADQTSTYIDVAALRGETLAQDLYDRDFTINALAIEQTPAGGWNLVDPLSGRQDLADRVLRAALPHSFVHDPVRTLRAVRMSAQFGCGIEPQTERALQNAVPLLGQVSAERIRDEWFKILNQPTAAGALRELGRLGLLQFIAPPVSELKGLELRPPQRTDALEDSFRAVEAIERLWAAFQVESVQDPLPPTLHDLALPLRARYQAPICDERTYLALLKCAALLHNVGRLPAQAISPGAQAQPPAHEQLGAQIAAGLGRQWRCSNHECEMLETAVRAHERPAELAQQPCTSRRDVHRYFRDTGQYGIDAALVSLANHWATGELAASEDWKRHAETVAQLLNAYLRCYDTVIAPPLLLSGRDLLATFDLAPGPIIGSLLARLSEEQAAGQIHTRPQAVAQVRQWLESQRLETRHKC